LTADFTFTETASFTNVGTIALRQYSATQRIIVDGIRIATNWADAVTSSGGNPTVAIPTFNPPGGTYLSAQNVTISTTTPDASIYYTTDGTDPTTNSTLYTGSFVIPRAEYTVLKFFAVDDTGNASPVQSETLSGYYAKDILTTYYAEGNIGVIVSLGGTGYGGGDPTYELDLPEGATIKAAYLCLAWTWYGYMPYTVKFNGNNVTNLIAHYIA
jgi:hypothetical protein